MVNAGIVGCGHISQKHALALEETANVRLVAVCDRIRSQTMPYVERYGAATYEKYEDLLAHPGLDAVIICTPSGLHAGMAEQAASNGKHILLEKPFVLNLTEGNNLVKLCRSRGVKLAVVHPNRVKPVVSALSKALYEGWFGVITHASVVVRWNRSGEYFRAAPWRGTRELDGGILYNQAIHNLDLFQWLVGPVDEVFAYGTTRLHSIEYEDVCVGVLKLRSGALGVMEAAITLYPENLEESLAIFGSQGTAVLGGKSLAKVLEWKFACLNDEQARQQIQLLNTADNATGHKVVVGDFVEAITNKREPLVSGEEALKTLYLIKAIYQSMEVKETVKVIYD